MNALIKALGGSQTVIKETLHKKQLCVHESLGIFACALNKYLLKYT